MSILTRRIVPIPSFRTPYVDTSEVLKPQPRKPEPTVAPATPATESAPVAAPEPRRVQTARVPEEPKGKRGPRNTRHPTTRPLDRPKPTPDPRKGGHPRAVASTVRDVKIVVSVSREEAAIWSALAQADGRSMAEWVRRTIFDVARVAERPHPERDVALGAIDSRNNKLK